MKTGLNVSLSNSTQNFSDYEGSSNSNVWYSAQFMAPIYPVYIKGEDGKDVLDADGNRNWTTVTVVYNAHSIVISIP